MGEIIPRAIPERALAFTGERLTSNYGGQTEIEHLHRYLLAREWCRNKDVLDIASGEGYGASMLAQVAKSAVGVEIAEEAVSHACESYKNDNLRFVQGDARSIPLDDATFDVVVSFETIEHFAEQPRFISEVRRVLRPGGLFIVSTPDRDNYSPAETPANPYHVQELTGPEFQELLQAQFENVGMVAQRPIFGSVIVSSQGFAVPPLCYERRGTDHFEGSRGLSRPQYFVAFASDGPLPDVNASVYIETGRLGMHTPQVMETRAQAAEQALEAQRVGAARSELVQLDRHAAQMAEERQRHEREISRLETELAAVNCALERAGTEELARIAAETQLANQSIEHAQARGEIKALIASNQMAEKAVASLRAETAKAIGQASEAKSALHEAVLNLRRSESDLTSAHKSNEATAALLKRKEMELADHRARLAISDQALHLMHRSTSWRVTRPLRALSRNLLRRP